jgi:hypothetical protein
LEVYGQFGNGGSVIRGYREAMNKQEQDRLTQLEIDTKEISTEIRVMKNNHLHHLSMDMERMDKKIDRIDLRIWSLVFGIITLLATTILANFL